MEKTILVVEDFRSVRAMIAQSLQMAGYNVLQASDGKEALKFFNGTKINLVITDLDMPNMDGTTLAKMIKGIFAYRATPIVMLTTKTQRDDTNISDWLTKPVSAQKLLEVVKKYLP
jgi:two-component system chemotaxis response regulator CheY